MRIVCLHGLGRTPADWDLVGGPLSQFGEVVAPQMGRDAVAALAIARDAVTPGSVIIGHSFGAVLGMRLATGPGEPLGGLLLTSSFWPPARNGRSLQASVGDYFGHRIEFVRGRRDRIDASPALGRRGMGGTGALLRMALRQSGFHEVADRIQVPVLVVHAQNDHYVPVDFACAGAARRQWELTILSAGGHYPQRVEPAKWLAHATEWLAERG